MPINKKKIILECYVNKLGGQIKGEVKVSEKIKKISDIKDSKKDENLSFQETLDRNKSK